MPPQRLGRVAEEVGEPARGGVHVDGAREHVGALGEDGLRAVAVVGVDVEQRDRGGERLAQPRGGERGVVEVAGAAVRRAGDVVARRSRAARRRRAPRRRATRSAAVSAASAAPRAPPPTFRGRSASSCRSSTCRSAPTVAAGSPGAEVEAGVGEDVGHDAVLAGVLRQPCGLPRVPGRAEEADEGGVVDREQRLVRLLGGRRAPGGRPRRVPRGSRPCARGPRSRACARRPRSRRAGRAAPPPRSRRPGSLRARS